jgi:D-ribose pyranase
VSYLIANLGHTDKIVIADCGLPIPPNIKKIDLALMWGIPGFIDTLKTVLSEMHVEKSVDCGRMVNG